MNQAYTSFIDPFMLNVDCDVFADRCEISNRQALEQIQDMYLEALEILLPVNHPDEDNILAKVLQVLVDLRSVSEAVRSGLRQITSRLIDFSQFPLVHHIIFS